MRTPQPRHSGKPARPHAGSGNMAHRPVKRPAVKRAPQPQSSTYHCEADVAEGLEAVAATELRTLYAGQLEFRAIPVDLRGTLPFDYTGNLRRLLQPKTIQAIYLVGQFDIPRPKALLGDENFRAMVEHIDRVRNLYPAGTFKSFYLSAAGSDSPVMQRVKADLAEKTGLQEGAEEGDLLLRLRHSRDDEEKWDLLVRISPRPLATRSWRVCNMEGALNATVAHAMALYSDPQPKEFFLNLCCGSAGILIERLGIIPARRAIGCDINEEAIACAKMNIFNAGLADKTVVQPWDARKVPLPDGVVDSICADLPFGHLVGSHNENVALYPSILNEAARLARPGASFVLITHEVRLMESLLANSPNWNTEKVVRVALGGLNPRIFVLRRAGS